ncbi:hypothetical protein L3X38_041899 [Prunus dulcis]|uniref:Aminotransferase-like plant mobile domain-containing protein n=1 Tax=Prunus dulcis TaxID=3755 RepID=A0AAD4UTU5_PRUDU|nr:hypothetical protein L3X38_041899 [Prunus dulcis]
MLFLLYWLNKFVFPNCSLAVLLEYRHLAEALHNHTDVGLEPMVLAHLFKNLHTTTLENPLNLPAPGAFWMIQIWLQVYFPELRFPDIVLPEDQVQALPLMSAEVPKRSIEEYLMFLKHCTKRSAAQWQVMIRTYPWFQLGFRLFEKEPKEEAARIDFRKKFLSVTLPRDLPHGGGKPPNYHLVAEVYHPNFCARQLGCPQLIPLKSYRSCNRASSWRDSDDLECRQTLSILGTIKDINAQVIEDPSLTTNIDRQSIQAEEVIVTSVIAVENLEPLSWDEEDETLAEQLAIEATPSGRRKKRKETAPVYDSAV